MPTVVSSTTVISRYYIDIFIITSFMCVQVHEELEAAEPL